MPCNYARLPAFGKWSLLPEYLVYEFHVPDCGGSSGSRTSCDFGFLATKSIQSLYHALLQVQVLEDNLNHDWCA